MVVINSPESKTTTLFNYNRFQNKNNSSKNFNVVVECRSILSTLDVEVLDEKILKQEIQNSLIPRTTNKPTAENPLKTFPKVSNQRPLEVETVPKSSQSTFVLDTGKNSVYKFQNENSDNRTILDEIERLVLKRKELEERYDKELKFQQASMHLISLYSSPKPISSNGQSKSLLKQTALPLETHLPALIEASKAYVDASNSIIEISKELLSIHQEESFLNSKLHENVLNEVILQKNELESRLKLAITEKIKAFEQVQILRDSDKHEEVVKVLCDELVKLKYSKK